MDPGLATLRATDYSYDVVDCDPDLADAAALWPMPISSVA